MTDDPERDDEDRRRVAFGLAAMRMELERKQAEVALAVEADEILDALDAGRALMVDGWAGPDAYLVDLQERIGAALAFPAVPWWRGSTPDE